MKIILIIFSCFTFIVSLSCTTESPLVPDSDLVVIQAYLYAGENIEDIRITSTLPLGSEETSCPPINDAEVWIVKEGQRYDLVPTPGDTGYYHYDGADLTVDVGDQFEINVNYFERIATGATTVPEAPGNVTISANTLYIPDFTDMDNMFNFDFDSLRNQVTITWNAVEDGLFYASIENIEADPDSIDMGGFDQDGMGRFFITPPTSDNEYTITMRDVSCYGQHRVKVYRVNQEYADLYISRQQDSRDLNEPLTNIQNGLGIFSAFNSSGYVFFNVVQE